jgi:uncharacterized OB-fold protein
MNNDLINRGDALAIAMHSKDPVEGIKHLPAVDAVEVVHANWENGMKCSECGQIDWTKPNYCPNCGAKMDGE